MSLFLSRARNPAGFEPIERHTNLKRRRWDWCRSGIDLESVQCGPSRSATGSRSRLRERPPRILVVLVRESNRHEAETGWDRWDQPGPVWKRSKPSDFAEVIPCVRARFALFWRSGERIPKTRVTRGISTFPARRSNATGPQSRQWGTGTRLEIDLESFQHTTRAELVLLSRSSYSVLPMGRSNVVLIVRSRRRSPPVD